MEFDRSQKVKIVSKKDAIIGIDDNNLNLHKTWNGKGTVVTIPYDVLEDAYSEPGTAYLFNTGLLYIEDMEVKRHLGIEPEDANEPVNVINLDDKTIKDALTIMLFRTFKPWFEKLTREQMRQVADFAIENSLIDYEKDQLIKSYVNVDIIKAIELAKQNEEAPPAKR